jgi:methenyltetrahydromethanopterin cyclohydrolase
MIVMIARLEAMIRQLEEYDDYDYSTDSDVSVSTLSAQDVDENQVTLRGRVYAGNEDEVTVYFEYGTSRSNLSRETAHRVVDQGYVHLLEPSHQPR